MVLKSPTTWRWLRVPGMSHMLKITCHHCSGLNSWARSCEAENKVESFWRGQPRNFGKFYQTPPLLEENPYRRERLINIPQTTVGYLPSAFCRWLLLWKLCKRCSGLTLLFRYRTTPVSWNNKFILLFVLIPSSLSFTQGIPGKLRLARVLQYTQQW